MDKIDLAQKRSTVICSLRAGEYRFGRSWENLLFWIKPHNPLNQHRYTGCCKKKQTSKCDDLDGEALSSIPACAIRRIK